MMEHRLVDIAARNADLFAMLHVRNGAPTDRFFDGLFNVVAIAAQETLAVYRALVLAVEASIDHIAHKPSGQLQGVSGKLQVEALPVWGLCAFYVQPAAGCLALHHCDFLTRRYHSESSRTCLSV